MNIYSTYMVANVDDCPKSITPPITIIREKK